MPFTVANHVQSPLQGLQPRLHSAAIHQKTSHNWGANSTAWPDPLPSRPLGSHPAQSATDSYRQGYRPDGDSTVVG